MLTSRTYLRIPETPPYNPLSLSSRKEASVLCAPVGSSQGKGFLLERA